MYLSWCVDPSQVAKMRVCRAANDFSADSFKLVNAIAKSDDFSRAYKSAENGQLRITNCTRKI